MQYTYELEQLRNGDRSPALIKRILNKHKERAEEMEKLYKRYKTTELPILDRVLDDPMQINNQLNNDYFSEIVDIKTGYFAGIPATYVNKTDDDNFQRFLKRNQIGILNSQTTKMAAVCGYAARLMYTDMMGETRIVNVDPWEAVLIGSNGIDEPEYGIRVYWVDTEDGKELRAELFEPFKSTEYRGKDIEALELFKEYKHIYQLCPLWGIYNNSELQGDAEKVTRLIDAIDFAESDVNSEIEAFRLAYLALFGVDPKDFEDESGQPIPLGQLGAIFLQNNKDVKQDMKFITKNIQADVIENHIQRLEERIYRFSKTPNFSQSSFGGNITGIALKHMLQPLENKTGEFERSFQSAEMHQWELLASPLVKSVKINDPYEIESKYTRNFPKDYLYEAQTSVALKGIVSELTRLGLLSFVTDAQAELDALEAQQEAYADLFMTGGGTIEPTTNDSTGNTETTNTVPKTQDAGTTGRVQPSAEGSNSGSRGTV